MCVFLSACLTMSYPSNDIGSWQGTVSPRLHSDGADRRVDPEHGERGGGPGPGPGPGGGGPPSPDHKPSFLQSLAAHAHGNEIIIYNNKASLSTSTDELQEVHKPRPPGQWEEVGTHLVVKVGDWEGSRGSNWGERWLLGVRADGVS